MPLKYDLKASDQLRWQHETLIIFDRRGSVVMTGKPDDVYPNGSLRLKKVDMSKAGIYTPSVHKDGTAAKGLKAVKLCVMGRLQICLDFG